jgi:ectoine hydroxylase-related dioxygenase (phytanoyl-CoA dioxygenase family)
MSPGDGTLKVRWTDRPDAMELLARKSADGQLPSAERDDVAHFIDHGWLLWRNAIDEPLIDRFVKDIHGHHKFPGYFITTNHRSHQSGLKLSGTVADRFESLFDLYVNLESSRLVCMHPRIGRFLALVFEARPIAFQQLLFQRSNQHGVHQDTSVVAVDDPMLLVATWIALEDVVEGSGELAYYDRSHKLPHHLFKDGSKRMNPAVDDRAEYVRSLDDECRRRGMAYERLLARKGDVFFWTADLVHCSHPRSLPDETSRLSCVTHYCPSTTVPFWFRYYPDKRQIEAHDMVSGFASMHYKLPTNGRRIAPSSPMA